MMPDVNNGTNCKNFIEASEHAFCFTAGSTNLLKYRALYEFVARNSDELSFQPGDVIMVSFIYCRCSVKRVTCGAGLTAFMLFNLSSSKSISFTVYCIIFPCLHAAGITG